MSDSRKGRLRRFVAFLLAPSARWSVLALLVVGGIGGIVFWGGFNTAMEATNRLEFCVSCHEMRDNVYVEYQETVHWKNASGVRAVCADCHVPKDWTAKLVRKIYATGELYHHFAGTIDTPEKFAAKRAELAEHVWATMRANDSRECRNCHSFEAMDFTHQRARSREKMEPVALGTDLSQGSTCIDCHKGIAHRLPPRDD
ncbi:MAG: cytochrome c-type protein [Alphaproteobacteria bacterium]|nr:MAG: cytochrome c-type protein [Alphaproteobacteria bacterium]